MKNILIVDDEVHFSQVLARSLGKLEHIVTIANSSQQAIKICQQQKFDWIVLDLRLAQESGLKLLPELKQLQASSKIVMLTGFASIATAVESIKLGAFNYLHKPATIKELLNAFEQNDEQLEEINEQPMSVERLEWEHIQRILNEHDGNITLTAKALNMHRRTLQRKLQKRPARS